MKSTKKYDKELKNSDYDIPKELYHVLNYDI